jgi:hypothetical protein
MEMTSQIEQLDRYLANPRFLDHDMFMDTEEIVSTLGPAEWQELAGLARTREESWHDNPATAVGTATIACQTGLAQCGLAILGYHPRASLQMIAHCLPEVIRQYFNDDAMQLVVHACNHDPSLRHIAYTVLSRCGREDVLHR